MAQNSSEIPGALDIDALMNSQGRENSVAGTNAAVEPPSNLKSPESKGLGAGGAPQNPPATQNGGQGVPMDVIDLTRPTKTEGEASSSGSTATNSSSSLPATGTPPLATNSTSLHSTVAAAAAGLPPVPSTADGFSSQVAVSAFGTPLSSLGIQLKLTAEEQASAYKKANLLALSALAKKGGPNVREMLGVQAKLQEFLTSLIALAGNTGPVLRQTVQALVQRLVVSHLSPEASIGRSVEHTHAHTHYEPNRWKYNCV